MEFCLVIKLTVGGNWAVTWPLIIASRYVSFAKYYLKYQIASSCYPQKKLISNTALSRILERPDSSLV